VFPAQLSWTSKPPEEYNWLNCHYRLFRPRDSTSRITISDWEDEETPPPPGERELLLDFVELQPYYADTEEQP